MLAIGVVVFAAVVFARLGLAWLNLTHQAREGRRIPPELAGEVDAAELAKINTYALERGRFGLLRSLASQILLAVFLFGGVLGAYDRWISRATEGFVVGGVAFFAGLVLLGALLEIPFGLYADFRIEAGHGFNRKSVRLWWSDWLKSTAFSLLLALGVSAAALGVALAAPSTWWIWVSVFLTALGLLLTFIAPYVIEPLFYRMQPLEVEGLKAAVQSLTERAGVRVDRVLTMDASRRSSHSNAYFTGLGRVKRVVLFDTLLAHMTHAQILAILAHELGHWKKHHVLARMLAMQVLLVLGLYLLYRLVPGAFVPELVGLAQASFPARVLILSMFGSLCLFPLTPLFSYWSRHDEREADSFAVTLHGEARDLADALSKLGRENLSSLHPHPLYAAFYYSHPPLAERVGRLRAMAEVRAREQGA